MVRRRTPYGTDMLPYCNKRLLLLTGLQKHTFSVSTIIKRKVDKAPVDSSLLKWTRKRLYAAFQHNPLSKLERSTSTATTLGLDTNVNNDISPLYSEP
jgi:hypothetical protein